MIMANENEKKEGYSEQVILYQLLFFTADAIDGWPVLQLRVLHELIYSARRMGNPAIAVRCV